VLAPLREVADEIVAVIDELAPDDDLTPLRDIADVAFAAPFTWPLEANLEWLHAQCSGDWVLRLDGDEAVGHELVRCLAGDDWHRGVTHCYLPRRWLVEGGTSWIDVNPWWPDPQLRLVRNRVASIRFGIRPHQMMTVDGPSRVLPAPIYHFDLVEADLQSRRAKARRYERVNPGLRTHGGLAMGAYYTPELMTPRPSTVPVPLEDRVFVDSVLADRPHRVPAPSRAKGVGSAGEGDTAAVAVEVSCPDSMVYAGRAIELTVTVANDGAHTLDPCAPHPFRVGSQWLDRAGTVVEGESRVEVGVLRPGERQTVFMIVPVPPIPGEYILSAGALLEGERWLARASDVMVTVVDQPQVVLAAGYSSHRHLGDDLVVGALLEELIDEFPQLRITLLADDPDAATRRFGVPARRAATHVRRSDPRTGPAGPVDGPIEAARAALSGSPPDDPVIVELADVLAGSDLYILAAAGSLASDYVDAALWPRLIEAEIAHAAGTSIVITSAGIGPFIARVDRRGARRLLSLARAIHVRDRLARRAVHGLRVRGPELRVVPDAAVGYRGCTEPELVSFLESVGVDPNRPYVVGSARPGDDPDTLGRIVAAMGTAARVLAAAVVLLPHCAAAEVDDRPALRRVAGMLGAGPGVTVLEDIPPDPVAASLVRYAHASIGSRYHNAVLSASRGRPAVIFCTTPFDLLRAEGLARLPGTNVKVMRRSARRVAQRTVRALQASPGTGLRCPTPHPLIDLIHDLGIVPKTVTTSSTSADLQRT
jgi:polysaccharide pyruvyl transferase WcaK-like protein